MALYNREKGVCSGCFALSQQLKLSSTGFSNGIGQFNRSLNLYRVIVIGHSSRFKSLSGTKIENVS